MSEQSFTEKAARGAGRGGRAQVAIRWLIVVLLSGICACLLTELLRGEPTASAQSTTSAGSGRFLAVAGQITAQTYGLYLLDVENGIITLYQWAPGTRSTGKLRLLAARNTTFDLQLDEYNTEPSPNEIKELIRQGRRLESAGPR